MEAKFVLSKKVLLSYFEKLKNLNLKVSYSYKTNREVGNLLKTISDSYFSLHAREEIEYISDKRKIWFFVQAESEKEIEELLEVGIKRFVVDNEVDLKRLIEVLSTKKEKIILGLRMKFKEHRIGTGKYFVYGMPSSKINELLKEIKKNPFIESLGVHLHRKSQNVSEWDIVSDLKDSLTEESLKVISFVNLGGGLPSIYRSSNVDVFDYIFKKIEEARSWLSQREIECWIEPGRFLAAPCISLETEVIQAYENNLVINTTIYNCALDNVLTNTKMLVQGELETNEEGKEFLIKGNSPTRDDIFRYKVKLSPEVGVGSKIVFLNAGAYNYTTDFFGHTKLKTEITE
jgi:ornithine decarboxylase